MAGPVKRGWITAIVLTSFFGLGALFAPVPAVFHFVVFLSVTVGLRRGRKWVGYGGALYLSTLIVTYALKADSRILWQGLAITIALLAVAAIFLFRAALAADDRRGSLTPWIGLSAASFLVAAVFTPYVLPSGSMSPTLVIGDSFLVQTMAFGAPKNGDLVAHQSPSNPRDEYIKRVVAGGGDRVRLRNKVLFVNGTAVNEPYVRHVSEVTDNFRDNFPQEPGDYLRGSWATELATHVSEGELVVPAGKYFVLGDNRDDSFDSRYWGFIDRSQIRGKPVMIYFSADAPTFTLDDAESFPKPVMLFPSRIRWWRIFKLL